jgi:hypothetical protein
MLLRALLLVLSATVADAATIIQGGNIISPTWTVSGSPYVVGGDITVPAGSTLTIEAGVEVQFASFDGQSAGLDAGRIEFTVNGSLRAEGTLASPIIFRASSGAVTSAWYGFVLNGLAAHLFHHVEIRDARYGIRSSEAQFSSVTVSSAAISSCDTGVEARGGSVTVENTRLFSNRVAVAQVGTTVNSSFTRVENSHIAFSDIAFDLRAGTARINSSALQTNRSGVLVSGPSYAIVHDAIISHSGTGVLSTNGLATFDRCRFFANATGLVSRSSCDLSLRNSLFYHNSNTAVAVASTGLVVNCTLHGNGNAFEVSGDARKTIANCLVTSNGIGIVNSAPFDSFSPRSFMFWGNVTNQVGLVLPGSLRVADPAYFNLGGSDAILGTVDDSFDIAASSPAIDAGENPSGGADFAQRFRVLDDPTQPNVGAGPPPHPDIGAYEFQPVHRITALRFTNGVPFISFNTYPAQTNHLEYTTNLTTWTSAATNIGNGTIVTTPDPTAKGSGFRVYRTRAFP